MEETNPRNCSSFIVLKCPDAQPISVKPRIAHLKLAKRGPSITSQTTYVIKAQAVYATLCRSSCHRNGMNLRKQMEGDNIENAVHKSRHKQLASRICSFTCGNYQGRKSCQEYNYNFAFFSASITNSSVIFSTRSARSEATKPRVRYTFRRRTLGVRDTDSAIFTTTLF